MSGNDNPGNFANRPKEDIQAAAQKGGQSSAGGFASMDPDKQVCNTTLTQIIDVLRQSIEGDCIHGWQGIQRIF